MNFVVELFVRPRDGVPDPQAGAVEESLHGLGYQTCRVLHVGRSLRMFIEANDASGAQQKVDEMCKAMLVNAAVETYDATIEAIGTA